MKLLEIFRFEFSYQVKRLPTWLFFGVVFTLAYTNLRLNWLADALYDDFFVNSPYIIAATTVFCCIVWNLAAAAVAGEASARDIQTGMHPLTYTTPIRKLDYLGGRFLAAFALNAMIMLAMPLGIISGVYIPVVDAEVIGPFRIIPYVNAYFFISIPTAFLVTSIQFAMAVLNRRAMSAYIGSLLVFVQGYIVTIAVGFLLGHIYIGRLLDPIGGMVIVGHIGETWTPGEKSTRLITLEGMLLVNRIIWISFGILVLVFTYFRFRLEHYVPTSFWSRFRKKKVVLQQMTLDAPTTGIVIPDIDRHFGLFTYVRQALDVAWPGFWMLIRRRGGIFVLGLLGIMLIAFIRESLYNMDVPQLPRTEYIIHFITTPLGNVRTSLIIVPLILVIYAGELVWRERDARVSELIDVSPVPEWTLFAGKFLSLAMFLVAVMCALAGAGIFVQLILSYHDFQIGLLIKVLFGLQLQEYLLFSVLALLVHTLVNQKYIAHLILFFIYALILFAGYLGYEDHLVAYGTSPHWFYSDMRGFGGSVSSWLWFKLYWSGWALLFAVVIRLFWFRGKENGTRMRLQLARLRFTKSTLLIFTLALMMIISLGSFIFYNTHVLNEYSSSTEALQRNADYERQYAKYKDIKQPSITGVKLNIELYPSCGTMDVRGTYRLVNKTDKAIDSIHIATVHRLETSGIKFDRNSSAILSDTHLNHHIYSLEKPLEPGDSMQMSFEVRLNPQGFRNSGINDTVVENGTYFTEGDERWMPLIGYQPMREIMKPTDRRRYKLPQRRLLPSLDEVDARPRQEVTLVDFDAVIGTDEGQTAVTTGELRRTWIENDRSYFHYVSSAPIGGSYSVVSAKYELKEEQWIPSDTTQQPVTIKIYYDADHADIVDHILPSVKASLTYHTKRFSAYPFRHITVVERGGPGRELSAESAFIDYGEGFTRFNPDQGEGTADIPFAVTAHEMGHQWWGGQIHYAMSEGAALLSESLAWYTAMGVVEETYGHAHLERLRGFMRQPYPIPPIRQSVPLIRASDPYAAYRKGAFAMYAMSQYVGKDTIDNALQSLIKKHNTGKITQVTTLDLYRELQSVTPDSLQYLVYDLFAANTFWDLDTKKVNAKQIDSTTWQVALDIEINKVTVDSTGVEVPVPLHDWIDVGVYGAREQGQELRKELYMKKHFFTTPGKQTIIVHVKSRPDGAGIDPNYLLIDTESHDNRRQAKIEE